MKFSQDEYNQAKGDMLGEFNRAITRADDLRRAAGAAGQATGATAQRTYQLAISPRTFISSRFAICCGICTAS